MLHGELLLFFFMKVFLGHILSFISVYSLRIVLATPP